MNKRKMRIVLFLLSFNIIFLVIYLGKLTNESRPSFGIVGLIPVIIGIFSFLYINRYGEGKTAW